MNKYLFCIEQVLSSEIEVCAETEQEAEEIVNNLDYPAYDYSPSHYQAELEETYESDEFDEIPAEVNALLKLKGGAA